MLLEEFVFSDRRDVNRDRGDYLSIDTNVAIHAFRLLVKSPNMALKVVALAFVCASASLLLALDDDVGIHDPSTVILGEGAGVQGRVDGT